MNWLTPSTHWPPAREAASYEPGNRYSVARFCHAGKTEAKTKTSTSGGKTKTGSHGNQQPQPAYGASSWLSAAGVGLAGDVH